MVKSWYENVTLHKAWICMSDDTVNFYKSLLMNILSTSFKL
jgi:hypothetical protein